MCVCVCERACMRACVRVCALTSCTKILCCPMYDVLADIMATGNWSEYSVGSEDRYPY